MGNSITLTNSKEPLMKRKILTLLALGVAALAVLTLGLDPSSVDAQSGCTDCEGPVRTVTGQGSGNSCGEALDNAETDAIQQAFNSPSGCRPCQTSTGTLSCYGPSCSGACPPNSYNASYTLNYKCRYCDFSPERPEM
jgi:hypothetical protein